MMNFGLLAFSVSRGGVDCSRILFIFSMEASMWTREKISLMVLCLALTTISLCSCGGGGNSGNSGNFPPVSQIVNNQTTATFVIAKIGNVTIPPPHQATEDRYVVGGSSSSFYTVAPGTNTITIEGTNYGTLSPFNINMIYAVNIRDGGCAELWIIRPNTNSTFNNDTTKQFVGDNGKCI
jgi:hypothetical protein